jgi:hypothetical protein
MKPRLICAVVFAAGAAVANAQTPTAPTSTSKKNDGKAVTITGCIGEDPSNAGKFTLADFTTGSTTYRLTGTDTRRYLGKRVSVTGAALPSKLAIVGGLVPSPNVAAQAGAIDPTRAAMAAQGTEGSTKPGNIAVPEFRVRSVQAIAGGCEHP